MLDFATDENRAAVLNAVAEAIYQSIFDEPLGPDGTIERALYLQAANDGLRAGVQSFAALSKQEDK